MTTESGIPIPESTTTPSSSFARSKLEPVAALLSFFGTLALVVSAIIPRHDLPGLLVVPVFILTCVFYLAALMTSSVAFLELLLVGLANAGSVEIGGKRLAGWPLGLLYLMIYLLPWLLIAGLLVFGVLLRSR